MIHRRQITAIDVDRPATEIVAEVTESEHTRIPLWRGEADKIIGVLNAKHLAQSLLLHKGDIGAIDIESLITAPWFVPDTTTLEEQLEAFRIRRSRLAIVVDEYGTLQGLVTVEDILSEIFGEMPDEHDDSRPDVRPRPDGAFLVDGTMPVRELNREQEWDLPDEGATTIAGLVIQETGTIPELGQRFAFFGFQFEILRRQRNQITALKVTPPPPQASEALATAHARCPQVLPLARHEHGAGVRRAIHLRTHLSPCGHGYVFRRCRHRAAPHRHGRYGGGFHR
jgi:Mg2+/Co2+ transporter CorB